MSWAPIRYRGFYDVPRAFVVNLDSGAYLFDCSFDEEIDDYPDSYEVYRLAAAHRPEDWPSANDPGIQRIGSVAVRLVTFDPTRREAIRQDVLESMTD